MGKKFDVIVVGELNVDLILNHLQQPPAAGKEVLAGEMILTLGSSSAIFASNLSSLGASVAFLGKIGSDTFGALVLQSLQEKKVDTNMIIRSESLPTGATVILAYGENNAMITHQGAMSHLGIGDISEDQLRQAGHLHFSSCFLQPALKKDIGELFRKAKACGLTTSFDAQWDPAEQWDIDLAKILPDVDVFLPNSRELLQLTGQSSVEAGLDTLRDFAHIVAVKTGNTGSVVMHRGALSVKPAYLNTEVVDAVGAGDSFNAGFVYKFIHQENIEACQDFGNLTGAMSTTAAGGTSAFNDMKNFMSHAKNRFGYQGNG